MKWPYFRNGNHVKWIFSAF